jgi:GDP-L-fucose synthase
MDKKAKIFVAGHNGLVGSAIVRKLKSEGYENILLRTRSELNLTDQKATQDFFQTEKPEYVIDSAAKVGGMKANMTQPAEFMYDNLQIQNNLIWSAKELGVKKLLFVGSSCIYPQDCLQPIKEEYVFQGPPEPANEAYGHAKIAGMKLCEYIHSEHNQKFISCTPTNLYGEGSDFNPVTAHVIPSLIRRMHEAKVNNLPEISIWGTGSSRREFLFVDDLAEAIVWLMNNYDDRQFVNVGTGEDISIKELAEAIQELVEYTGNITYDTTKPDGRPRRLLDVSKLHNAGWHHTTQLEDGLKKTYDWYLSNINETV